MVPTLGPTGSAFSFRIGTLVFLLYSSATLVANAFTVSEPYYVSRNPPILMVNETGSSLTASKDDPYPNAPHSIGIILHVGTVPILPQAVGGILSQALYKAFLELGPEPSSNTRVFEHDYSESFFSRVCFDVGVSMIATETQPGKYALTNARIATVLSLMGFDFSRQDNLGDLREYHFDIVVDEHMNQTTIGHGLLRNTNPVHRPFRTRNGLMSPRCNMG